MLENTNKEDLVAYKYGSSSECVLTFREVKLAKSVDHGQGECLFAAITPGSMADGFRVIVHRFN